MITAGYASTLRGPPMADTRKWKLRPGRSGFISPELDKTVRWKMAVYPNRTLREVIYRYQWEVTDNSTHRVDFPSSSFRFSSLSFEDYHRLFSKHGFALIDKEERLSERDGISERHFFLEYRRCRDIG